MQDDNKPIEAEAEIVFEGGKDKKPPKSGKGKWRREVNVQPIISDDLFITVKNKFENRNKLK